MHTGLGHCHTITLICRDTKWGGKGDDCPLLGLWGQGWRQRMLLSISRTDNVQKVDFGSTTKYFKLVNLVNEFSSLAIVSSID